MHNLKSLAAALAFASFAAPAFADEQPIKQPASAEAVETRAVEAAAHVTDKSKPDHTNAQAHEGAASTVTANAPAAGAEGKDSAES